MQIQCRARCSACQAPLKVSFVTSGDENTWLYTWVLKENINLGNNTMFYKKVGPIIKRVCFSCYYGSTQKALSVNDIFDWLKRGQEYVQTAEVDYVPILFRWTYWLFITGLYNWKHSQT